MGEALGGEEGGETVVGVYGRGVWPKYNLSPTAGPVSIFMGYSPYSSAEVEPSSNSSP